MFLESTSFDGVVGFAASVDDELLFALFSADVETVAFTEVLAC